MIRFCWVLTLKMFYSITRNSSSPKKLINEDNQDKTEPNTKSRCLNSNHKSELQDAWLWLLNAVINTGTVWVWVNTKSTKLLEKKKYRSLNYRPENLQGRFITAAEQRVHGIVPRFTVSQIELKSLWTCMIIIRGGAENSTALQQQAEAHGNSVLGTGCSVLSL
jgi:hypothetical protein